MAREAAKRSRTLERDDLGHLSSETRSEVNMSEYLLKHPKGELPLPVREGTEAPSGINVGGLLKETGHVALDHGFMNTAACESKITFIDGDEGILRYRGYPIEELAEKSTFLEVS